MRNISLMKVATLLFSAVMFASTVFAQQKVSGIVTDATNLPVAGVGVIVKGTTIGTATDGKGAYTLTIPATVKDKTLVFSFIGYDTEERKVASSTTKLNVQMKESSEQIEAIEVNIGYGTTLKSDLTGSVATVKIDETQASQVASFDQLLQGRAAGVQVTSGNAAPGGAVNITIRGNGSLSNNEPLYVVDGVIMNGTTASDNVSSFDGAGSGFSGEAQNGLAGIATSDIASMEVLKDASATAIYGNLGANGVVIITTKQGQSERPRVEWTSNFGLSEVNKRMDILDGQDYFEWGQSASVISSGGAYNNWEEYVALQKNNYNRDLVDWQKYVMRTAISHSHNVSISGRTKGERRTSYYLSFGYSDGQGIVRKTGQSQMNMRLNLDKQLNKKIRLTSNTSFSYNQNRMTSGSGYALQSQSSLTSAMIYASPFFNFDLMQDVMPEDDGDDEWAVSQTSPAVWFRDYDDVSTQYRVVPSLSLEFNMGKGFKYTAKAGADYRYRTRDRWMASTLNRESAGGGRAQVADSYGFTWNTDHTINFNRSFNRNHRLNAMVGMSMRARLSKTATTYVTSVPVETVGAGSINYHNDVPKEHSYGESKTSLLSFFARAIYTFKDKYTLTATYRADGSSNFAEGNKFGFFPSMAFAWRLKNEKILNLPEWISDAKVRAGWGQVGNQGSVPAYRTLAMYGGATTGSHYNASGIIQGYVPSALTNPDLKWETTEQYNLGLDLSFFDSRVNFTVDWYDKETKDLLQSVAIPASTGYTAQWMNRGVIGNKGIEITMDVTPIKKRDFSLNVAANVSFNKNEIIDIGQPPRSDGWNPYVLGSTISSGSIFQCPANIFMEGYAMGMFWGYKTDGLYQTDEEAAAGPTFSGVANTAGDLRIVDQNGDGKIDPLDRTLIGNPNPEFTGGLNINVRYKRLTLDLGFNGVYGNELVNANLMRMGNINVSGHPLREYWINRWTPENPNTRYPAFHKAQGNFLYQLSDFIIEDASFLRLSNVTLTYDVPVKKNSWIKGLTVNLTGSNLWVLTDYSGWDPEVSSFGASMSKAGVDWSSYPRSRGIIMGVKVSF